MGLMETFTHRIYSDCQGKLLFGRFFQLLVEFQLAYIVFFDELDDLEQDSAQPGHIQNPSQVHDKAPRMIKSSSADRV
jgi:hypothetical protein